MREAALSFIVSGQRGVGGGGGAGRKRGEASLRGSSLAFTISKLLSSFGEERIRSWRGIISSGINVTGLGKD